MIHFTPTPKGSIIQARVRIVRIDRRNRGWPFPENWICYGRVLPRLRQRLRGDRGQAQTACGSQIEHGGCVALKT
jgi:hypothetical protein